MNKRKIENLIRNQGISIRPSDDIRLRIQNELGIETKQKRISSVHKPTFSYALAGGLAFAVIAVIALAILVSGVGYAGDLTETYISIDINPSIEFTVSTSNIVTDVKPMNEDAVALLYGESLQGLSIDDALDTVIELAIEIGYIDESGDNAVKYVVINGNLDKETQLSNHIKQKLQNSFTDRGINCEVLAKFGNATSAEAKLQRVSVGKMELIKAVREIDKSLKVPTLKEMSVSELNEIIMAYNPDSLTETEIEIEDNIDQLRNQIQAEINILSANLLDIMEYNQEMKTEALSNPESNFLVKAIVSDFNSEYPDYEFIEPGQGQISDYYQALFNHMESVVNSMENDIDELESEYGDAEKNGKKAYASSGTHGNQNPGNGPGPGSGRGQLQ